tara:strand:+ start:476 stop:826 length:351 start_codon:yes stop_codon:yes gene_type:complete
MKWYSIQDLYTIDKYKIKHSKTPATKWIRLPCVYKIKIENKIVHVGRSDTCKKHGGAEKVRKALVNLLGIWEYNPSVTKTKIWEKIRLQHKPNSSNIKIGIIETNAIEKTYLQEAI